MVALRQPEEEAFEEDAPSDEEASAPQHENALEKYRKHLRPVNKVRVSPPAWVLPGFLPPGLTVLSGPPKTFKSRLVLHFIACVVEGKPFNTSKLNRAPPRKHGTAIYLAAEQSEGRIRHIYETKVIKRKLKEGAANWDFTMMKEPLNWQLDEPYDPECDLVDLIRAMKPTLLVIDPLINFHSIDENDPGLIRPLQAPRREMLKNGGSLLVVHHNKKEQKDQGGSPWDKMRGTGALWGTADGGLSAKRLAGGAIHIQTEFKDHEPSTEIWRPEV